jgi:hypothetical protein
MFVLLAGVMLLAACESASNDPGEAVTSYLEALVEKDREAFDQTYCADFEREAATEFDSFGAVDAALEDVTCEAGDATNGFRPVTCSGAIQITYDGERQDQAMDLSARTYRVTEEDGEWLMCGYAD